MPSDPSTLHWNRAAPPVVRRGPASWRAPERSATVRWLVSGLVLLLVGSFAPPAAAQVTVTDLAGRSVRIPAGPQRLLIDDGRYLLALALLSPDPVKLLAAWPHDAHRIGAETYDDFVGRFPALPGLPRVASSAEAFSLELALAADPTVAIVTLGRGPGPEHLRALEAAGIPVVFVDFLARPLDNLDESLRLLGTVIGREEEAEAFVGLRRERRSRIEERLATANPDRPSVFIESHAGMAPECCSSPGRGGLGEYVALAGGENIGAEVLPGVAGQLSLEYIIQRDPEVYIATGGPHLAAAGGFVVGPGFSTAASRQSLERMASRTGLRLVGAVRNGRVHGLAHQLLNSPLDIVALELLASWIHPDLFADLDPRATLDEINRRFLAVPLEGEHWVDLP